MKKIALVWLSCLLVSLSGYAQPSNGARDEGTPFRKGKTYLGASLSGLDLNYNSNDKWHLGLDARLGWMFEDNWMLLGSCGFEMRHHLPNTFTLGLGARYYIEQNGLFLGAGANYFHEDGVDDLRPSIQIGYAFFLNRSVTIEPEIYYNQSLKNHSDYSGFGIRLGVGIYFSRSLNVERLKRLNFRN